jgi:hypothetical protein
MSEYSYRRSGSTGCEIIDPDGLVIAWTVDAAWAALIVELLNWAEGNGLRPAPCHQHDGGTWQAEASGQSICDCLLYDREYLARQVGKLNDLVFTDIN